MKNRQKKAIFERNLDEMLRASTTFFYEQTGIKWMHDKISEAKLTRNRFESFGYISIMIGSIACSYLSFSGLNRDADRIPAEFRYGDKIQQQEANYSFNHELSKR